MLFLPKAQATHLIGGYMSYEYLRTEANNDKLYKISLNLFRDMTSGIKFDEEISVGIYYNTPELKRHKLLTVKRITQSIVRPPGSEDCGFYDNRKIETAFYERTVTLADHVGGYHVYFVRCCRSLQNNLTNNSNGTPDQGQTYYCFIPNPALKNSSPYFSGVPSPYMCNNDTNTFLNRAVDPDGDSLVYSIVHPYQGGSLSQSAAPEPPVTLRSNWPLPKVEYKAGYDSLFPFGTDGLAQVNPSNGLTTLMAREPGNYVIAIEVNEYRNGEWIGRVRLDMQIIVLNCPPNKKPVVSNSGGKYFEVEAGDKLCFDVFGNDPDINPQQNVTIFATGDIVTGDNGITEPLATMVRAVGLGSVQSEFCWTPSCDQARDEPYLVTLSAQDNGCPPKYDNYNIEIKVKKFIGADDIQGPDRACAATSYDYTYQALVPTPGSTFWWDVDKGNLVGDSTSDQAVINFTGSGIATIRMVEISPFGCPGDTVEFKVNLIPTPSIPVISGKDTVCLGEVNVVYTVADNPGSTFQWILPDGSIDVSTLFTMDNDWNQLGDFELRVVESNSDGCRSDTGVFQVNVRKPNPGVYGSRSVCPNSEDVAYMAIGHPSSSFNWTVSGGTQTGGGNTKDITITWGNEGLGSITVVETDKWGCVSDDIQVPVNKTYTLDGPTPEGDQSVCEFDMGVPYQVVEANGAVYRWSISGGTQATGDSTSKITVDWGATGAGIVAVQEWAFDAVNQRECISPIIPINVVINPLPTADYIEGDYSFCQGDEVRTYTINGFAGSTYHWEINGSDQNITGQGTNQIEVAWPDFSDYTLTVWELTKDSCPGQLIDTTVRVHPIPTADEIQGNFIVCYPDVTQHLYGVNGFPNSTYEWFTTNGTSLGSTVDSIKVDWVNSGYAEIMAVETSEYGCIGDTIKLPVYINRLEIDLDVVTVGFPDDHITGDWRTIHDDLTQDGFQVERRSLNSNYWSAVSNEHLTSFFDRDVQVDDSSYQYRITATDLCGNVRTSEVHESILLQGEQDNAKFELSLNFSPYIGWDNGVQQYELYRSVNGENQLSLLQSVNAGEEIIIAGDNEAYRQCFRVLAYEEGGQSKQSWSNEICFYLSPNVFVPTAFSPNRDGLNETFNPRSFAVKTYKIQVFNRWGQLIYVSDSKDEPWDGTYNNVESPMGVYMYIINFTDAQDKSYQKSGTFHLFR